MPFVVPSERRNTPTRIISVVPSKTELLFHLGLEHEVVGITKFCIHPPRWFSSKTRVGGTKTLKLDVIRQLQPDLIIANEEENTRQEIETLATEFPVYLSYIRNLEDAYSMIADVGKLTAREDQASQLIREVKNSWAGIKIPTGPLKVLYLIWRKPWMAAGRNTFINSLLELNGWENALPEKLDDRDLSRYPELTEKDITAVNPDVILLSSEPYPFGEKHIGELQNISQHSLILLADGEMYSWYGSRLKFSAAHFKAAQQRLRSLQ